MQMTWALISLVGLLTGHDDDLGKAAKKASEMTCYTFKIESKTEGGKKPVTSPAIEGKFQKDQPLSMKTDKDEVFKKGDVLVFKEGEEWKKYERQKGGNKVQGKAGTGVASFLAVRNPHEELEGFDKKIKEAKKADAKENDCTVYSGDLTDEAAKELGNPNRGGKGSDLTYSGTAKVWVNGDGAIVKYELVIKVSGTLKNNKTVNNTVTKTVQISAVGSTKVEVPDGAKKVLEGAP